MLGVEADPRAFGQRLEAVALDRRVVDEQVLPVVIGVMKPKPLSSLNHLTVPVAILLSSGL